MNRSTLTASHSPSDGHVPRRGRGRVDTQITVPWASPSTVAGHGAPAERSALPVAGPVPAKSPPEGNVAAGMTVVGAVVVAVAAGIGVAAFRRGRSRGRRPSGFEPVRIRPVRDNGGNR
ncbi:hypothetical protein BJY18_002605 [Amycolatopsis jiangsuensis]|uniref:Uncharacterized protein n=1 Tax=Amycolatopsis jiangsuensis TaxID=1181879 RepID=A0A840ITC9_9PSEU|nr:hypothetical protein [Amycolatopsis jiangsuensis]